MLAWLSDWLRAILAVVLLAAVIDLIMPGKTFHRYTRLVLGLLILLAMLGPILRLLEGDPAMLLDRGIRSWEASTDFNAPAMPNLADIQRDAEALRKRQQEQTAELAARGLEAAMLEALNRGGGMRAEAVQVGLAAGADGEAAIASVTVMLAPDQPVEDAQRSAGDDGDSSDTPSGDRLAYIEPVREVAVAIGMDGGKTEDGSRGRGREDSDAEERAAGRMRYGMDTGWRHAPEPAASAVRSIVYAGWGVEPERIVVLTPVG